MNPKIGIIGGKGRMGRLFASFFKERGITPLVSDIATKLSNKELAKAADICIVCVPIDKTEKIIKEVLPFIKKESAIMDFTSIKEMPIRAMLKGKCEVLGMHPMFGNSNPIPGQTVILCETRKSGKWSKWMEEFLKKNKVKVEKMSAKEHDKAMSVAQGLIHFADIAFVDGLRSTNTPITEILKFTSLASELKIGLASRLINQDPNLYGNIQICNPNNLKVLKNYKKSIEKLIKIIQKKDLKKFEKYFLNSQKAMGAYSGKSYKESSYLIDKLMEKRNRKPQKTNKRPKKNDIALLGPKNTFSDIAAGDHPSKFYTKTIEEVFELVENGKVKKGIVPIENKVHGTVRETLDSLFSKNVQITEELNIPIHHALLIMPHAKKTDIKTIISHQQPINQCKKFIKKHFPKSEKLYYSSSAAAVEKLLNTRDKSVAVIAPEIAASCNELKVFKKNIEDEKDNSTKFIIIEKGKAKSGKAANKTSIAFYFDADSPGSLFSVFQDFAKVKINMTKIESRPTKAKFGEYIFYLDFEGGTDSTKAKKTLAAIKKKVAKLKILGYNAVH